jgi:hypothetical protein
MPVFCSSLAFLLLFAGAASARSLNGFPLEGASIPANEIRRGGPPRDGIPALDHPVNVGVSRAPWSEKSLVVGVEVAGQARAYPIAILNWHELVNDRLGGRPILVSFCPLCGTAMVFDRRVRSRTLRFGVSGLLYQSDLLMFDRSSESLWSQISAEAVSGPLRGERLRLLRARTTTWGEWRSLHPATTVLSRDTGHARDYGSTPYAGYEDSERLYFPAPLDRRHHPKSRVVGLRLADGRARAYPAAEIRKAGGQVTDRFAGHEVRIEYHPADSTFDVSAPDEVDVIEGFWFAWMAFHPGSTVYRAGE